MTSPCNEVDAFLGEPPRQGPPSSGAHYPTWLQWRAGEPGGMLGALFSLFFKHFHRTSGEKKQKAQVFVFVCLIVGILPMALRKAVGLSMLFIYIESLSLQYSMYAYI